MCVCVRVCVCVCVCEEFCLHVAAYNIGHGLMKYPASFNPTKTGGSKRGRPSHAQKGGALGEGDRNTNKTAKSATRVQEQGR